MILPGALFAPPFAHRGLWRTGGPPENSLAAFDAACRAGYGIELDVRLSSDGEAMVFHDESLERLAGVKASVFDLTARELGALPLLGGPDRIPTLRQVLERVDGRALLLVEIKAQPDGMEALQARTAELLARYEGPAAVISFSSEALAWFADHEPARLRGLDAAWLSDHDLAEEDGPDVLMAFEAACAAARPHFLALELETAEGRIAGSCREAGLPVIAWTVRSPEDAARVARSCDNFIFEGFDA